MNEKKVIDSLPSKRQLKEMRRKGYEVLKASRRKSGYPRNKNRKCYISESKLLYSEGINNRLAELYVQKLPSGDIKRYVSKHRAGIISRGNLMSEIRHNFTNYDNILKNANKWLNYENSRELHDILKKECNELIADTYPEFEFCN